MSKKHLVLWIDDEWDKMSAFRMECEDLYGLKLEPYKTCKEGLLALERDLDKWDAVLLDAKMFDDTVNEVASIKGLGKAKKRLDELSSKKKIPYFIFTGQPDLLSSDNFRALFGDFYEKSVDEEKLMIDIVEAIELSKESQIKSNYHHVFSSLDSLGIKNYTEDILLDILLPLHYKEKEETFRPVHHYTQLRKVIEYLFRACHKVGLVPDACLSNGMVNLNQCSLYVAGKNPEKINQRYGKECDRIVPKHIEKIIRSVLELGNTCSHTVDLDSDDIEKIENLFKSMKSNYLIYGLTLQLCEAVVWFANYIATHNDKEINLQYCNPLTINDDTSIYEGKDYIVEQDEKNNYHCGQCRLSYKAAQNYKGMLVTLYEVTESETKNKDGYPYYARFKVK